MAEDPFTRLTFYWKQLRLIRTKTLHSVLQNLCLELQIESFFGHLVLKTLQVLQLILKKHYMLQNKHKLVDQLLDV